MKLAPINRVTAYPPERIEANPRYVHAPLELAYVDQDGNFITKNVDPFPARFETEEHARAFMDAVGTAAKNKVFREFGVPYFLVTRPDGTTYESW